MIPILFLPFFAILLPLAFADVDDEFDDYIEFDISPEKITLKHTDELVVVSGKVYSDKINGFSEFYVEDIISKTLKER